MQTHPHPIIPHPQYASDPFPTKIHPWTKPRYLLIPWQSLSSYSHIPYPIPYFISPDPQIPIPILIPYPIHIPYSIPCIQPIFHIHIPILYPSYSILQMSVFQTFPSCHPSSSIYLRSISHPLLIIHPRTRPMYHPISPIPRPQFPSFSYILSIFHIPYISHTFHIHIPILYPSYSILQLSVFQTPYIISWTHPL